MLQNGYRGAPVKFKVEVPKIWEVNAGEYPVGLYWKLANEFSNDAGLDLIPLKGTSIEVWPYSLVDGLPGEGEQSSFNYPSDAILLVDNNEVKGAWLVFNTTSIGPSVKKRYLKDITGLTFEQWIDKEGVFPSPGKNSDLALMNPFELLKAYFKAIDDGDKVRANACMDPGAMLESLTMNFRGEGLYNPEFNEDNSLVENIIKANPINFRLMDNKNFGELQNAYDRTEIEVEVTLNIKWSNSAFNSPNGLEDRFAILKKYSNGWKLRDLGTGAKYKGI